MKKLILLPLISGLFGCSPKLIQKTDVAVVTENYKHVYFLNNDVGQLVYAVWTSDSLPYGDTTKAHLVNSTTFKKMVERAVAHPNYSSLTTSQR